MAQAAFINFFGESGTVTSIMNTVQPSHTQTSTEPPNQPELNISENQQGTSLPVSTNSYTIPHLTHSRRNIYRHSITTKLQQTKLQSTTILH